MYRAAFPYLKMIVDDEIATEDKIVPRWHSEGTHRGEVAGLAPTGVRASATGVSIDQWKDGKVIEAWVRWDNLGLARQLGAASPKAVSARRSAPACSACWPAGCAGRTRASVTHPRYGHP
jgi:SnoaL-like polyketide cyclase